LGKRRSSVNAACLGLLDQPSGDPFGLMHRYQTRLMLLLRTATVPNEPSPISEHSASIPPAIDAICLPAPEDAAV
jgi:hypothetical protein